MKTKEEIKSEIDEEKIKDLEDKVENLKNLLKALALRVDDIYPEIASVIDEYLKEKYWE